MTSSGEWAIARATHQFGVPSDAVFDAWLNPDLVQRWGAGSEAESAGGEVESIEIDARVGGGFVFTVIRDGEELPHHGEYLEIDRPHRLVFTWMPEPNEHSVVSMDFQPTAEGCTVSLTHEMGQQWADYVDRTAKAWSTMLDHIGKILE